MKFTPIFDRVVIKRTDSDLKKKVETAGLILPDKVDDSYKASQGTLVQAGSHCHDDVLALLGKEVLFARYSGDEIKIDGEEFLLASDKDIFGGIE